MAKLKRTELRRCERCHVIQVLHIEGACPDGQGQFLQRRHPRMKPFASQSFTAEQVDVLTALVKKLLAGNADVLIIARSEDFRTAAAKILKMKQRVEEMRNGKP